MDDIERLAMQLAYTNFTIIELGLFLDTHPTDQAALAMMEENQKKYALLAEEYTRKYGPLSIKDVTKSTMWKWIENPWPWEYSSRGGL